MAEDSRRLRTAGLSRLTHQEMVCCLAFILLYALVANVPFALASRAGDFVPWGTFCVEYLLVGALSVVLPRWLAAALLLLTIVADVLSGLALTYFVPPLNALSNVGLVFAFDARRIAALVMVVIASLLVTAAAALFPISRMRAPLRGLAAAVLISLAVLGLAKDYFAMTRIIGRYFNPWSEFTPAERDQAGIRGEPIFRRPSMQVIHQQIGSQAMERMEQSDPASGIAIANASNLGLEALKTIARQGSQASPNLVLVLVESWGQPEDRLLRAVLMAPYLDPALVRRYQVIQGEVPFHGSTIAAEARELCGEDLGFKILSVAAPDLAHCLPAQLKSLGYHEIAAHGNSGKLFRRIEWYSRIGFDEKWFREEFHKLHFPDCRGAFLGDCDAAIAQWIGTRISVPGKQPEFVHWVTLNSHLPLPAPSSTDELPCSAVGRVSADPSLCSWAQIIARVHRSMATVAMQNHPRQTIFVLVGDHAPPFGEPALRSLFAPGVVPYVVLIPRQSHP